MKIVVSANKVVIEDKEFACSTGKAGLKKEKVEGDWATPAGEFVLGPVFYRADRTEKPETKLEVVELKPGDGWCFDPEDERYNTLITRENQPGNMGMWRDDHIFDLAVFVQYNTDPIVKGKGSGIFIHLAREGYTPTAGCIGLSEEDLRYILKNIDVDTTLYI